MADRTAIEWTPPEPRSGGQWRERNALWKGGRTVASNGYVLIKVPPGHHLADRRGYAYEHRLRAEEKIGRRLLPGEQVHHIDLDRQNNDPANLDVVEQRQHMVLHRTSGRPKRMPGEPNIEILCACGCGSAFRKYDACGRPRRFVTGHNMWNRHG